MKKIILEILQREDDYISGQKICDKLGVSRTAIWKQINNLKKDGYNIKSTSNKGYKLVTDEKTINEYEIKKHLEVDMDVFYVDETISTNLIAKEKALCLTKAMGVVVASKQNSGKGRMGRNFSSNNEDGLWNTFIFKPDIAPEMATFFTIGAGIAVCKVLKELANIEAKIKWPNDVIVNNKKICGILSEMSCEVDEINYVIVGIGINVFQEQFEKELENIATSIYINSKKKVKKALLCAKLCYYMKEIYDNILLKDTKSIIDAWEDYSLITNKEIRIIKNNESFICKAKGIDEKGRLIILDKDNKEKTYNSGEISIRGIMGYI